MFCQTGIHLVNLSYCCSQSEVFASRVSAPRAQHPPGLYYIRPAMAMHELDAAHAARCLCFES